MDHNLEKYGKDPPKNNGDLLFGKEFCAQLKSQVESDKALSQVVTLANRYQPCDKSRQSTLGRSRKQLFRQSPVGKWGSQQGYTFSSSKQSQKPTLNTNPVSLPTIHWLNWGNLKHASYTTCVPAGNWIEHKPPSSTRVYASGRQDSPVPRELGATNPRPEGIVNISAATESQARETQLQIPTEREGARHAPR